MYRQKSVLYIAFHYPPILGSSGVHRTLAFSRFLANKDWKTTILTASVKGYNNWSKEQYDFIPQNVEVIRVFCRVASKYFSINGKYLSWMALPDKWQSWILPAIVNGLRLTHKSRPQVIVSTYPIASAHIIAYALHRITGIPWVADFRDPMAQDNYPANPLKKRVFQWIEKKAVTHCKKIIFTSPGAVSFYQKKFPTVDKQLWELIPNGYDSEIFDQLNTEQVLAPKIKNTLLHSGVIYPDERDPSTLFRAIAELKSEGILNVDNFNLKLRATGHDKHIFKLLEDNDITDLIHILPAIPYKQALQEMLEVDVLLLLQADNCDFQIPAKAYEYIKVKKPILAITSISGDTGKLMQETGVSFIAPINDKEQIKNQVIKCLDSVEAANFTYLDEAKIATYSRQHQAIKFEKILQMVINGND